MRSIRSKYPPEKLYDLLYYATLYVGEGGTTASEAATLGTRAIHISTTAKYCGLFNMLHEYGLMWTFDNEKGFINISRNLLQEKDLWKIGIEKRDSMIEDNLDVTDFMVGLINEQICKYLGTSKKLPRKKMSENT